MIQLIRVLKPGLLALLACLVVACSSGPPVQEMSDARQAIAAVGDVKESARAADLLSQARELLLSAEVKLRKRAYNGAKVDAVEARRKAVEALGESEQPQQKK